MINWLMGWPAGLKLNNDLAKFLGDLFLWVINYWAGMFLLHCLKDLPSNRFRVCDKPAAVPHLGDIWYRLFQSIGSVYANRPLF